MSVRNLRPLAFRFRPAATRRTAAGSRMVRASNTSANETFRDCNTRAAVRAGQALIGSMDDDAALDAPNDGNEPLGFENAKRFTQ